MNIHFSVLVLNITADTGILLAEVAPKKENLSSGFSLSSLFGYGQQWLVLSILCSANIAAFLQWLNSIIPFHSRCNHLAMLPFECCQTLDRHSQMIMSAFNHCDCSEEVITGVKTRTQPLDLMKHISANGSSALLPALPPRMEMPSIEISATNSLWSAEKRKDRQL